MVGRVVSLLVSGAGLALIVAALAADLVDIGAPGFGWKQLLGTILGAMLTVWGVVLFQAGGSPRAGWRRWRHMAAVVATWQARVLYSVVYVLLIIPLGVLLRWLSDPLRLRRSTTGQTAWRERSEPADLQQWARSQF